MYAVFDIHDNFTGGLRRTGAQMDAIEILEYPGQGLSERRAGDDPEHLAGRSTAGQALRPDCFPGQPFSFGSRVTAGGCAPRRWFIRRKIT